MCGGAFMETCGYMWGSNTKKKTLKQRFKVFFFGGALSTAAEPSNRLQHSNTEFQCFP